MNMYSCVHFDSCSAPRCPRDPDRRERVRLRDEPRCRGYEEGIRCDVCGRYVKRVTPIAPPIKGRVVDYEVNEGGVYAITGDGTAWRFYNVCGDGSWRHRSGCTKRLHDEGGGVIRLRFRYKLTEVTGEDGEAEENPGVRDFAQAVPGFGV